VQPWGYYLFPRGSITEDIIRHKCRGGAHRCSDHFYGPRASAPYFYYRTTTAAYLYIDLSAGYFDVNHHHQHVSGGSR
jgi:hypothetical protein